MLWTILLVQPANVGAVQAGHASSTQASCSGVPMEAVMAAEKDRNEQTGQEPPRVLVTGAGGFIGSHVAEACAELMGFTVIAMDDLSGGFLRNLEWLRPPSLFVRGDLQNETVVSRVFAEHGPFSYVYHLAAYAAEGLSHFIRDYNYRNNLGASVILLNNVLNQRQLKGTPVRRLVFTSSIAAFGAVTDPSELPMTEATPQRPEDPYGVAKHAVELDLKAAYHMFQQNYTIFRPHNVYGPRQNIADKFRNAIGIFMNQILHKEPMTIFGDGSQTRGFSYIEDVALPIAASVLYETAAQEAFFVGTDIKYSVKDLARLTSKAMGKPAHPIVHLEQRKEVAEAYASHDKLRCIFNPKEAVPLELGLKITSEYVQRHYVQGDFEPTGYSQIEVGFNLPPSWRHFLAQMNKQHSKASKVRNVSTMRGLRRRGAVLGQRKNKSFEFHALEAMCIAARAPPKGVGIDVRITDGGRFHHFLPWDLATTAARAAVLLASCGGAGCTGNWDHGCCQADSTTLTWVVHRQSARVAPGTAGTTGRFAINGAGRSSCTRLAVKELSWAPRIVCSSKTATLLELKGRANVPLDARSQLLAVLTARRCPETDESLALTAVISDWLARQTRSTVDSLDVARVPKPGDPRKRAPVWRAEKRKSILQLWDADAASGRSARSVAPSVQALRNASVPPIAVISYGMVRSTADGWFERSFGALQRYVLEPLTPWAVLFADYSCPPGACIPQAVHGVMGKRASSLCMTTSVPWEQIYKLDAAMCNWTRQESQSKETPRTRLANRHFYLMGMWSLRRAILAVQRERAGRGIASTIITRIDTLFFSPSFLDVLVQRPWNDAGRLFVPEIGNYGFLSDQFAYGHADLIHRYVIERLHFVMGVCHAQMPPEGIACHVASLNNWSIGTALTRFVRLRADWEVPHRDIIGIFPGSKHRCCGEQTMARIRALPAKERDCMKHVVWAGDRPIPKARELDMAAQLLMSDSGDCPV